MKTKRAYVFFALSRAGYHALESADTLDAINRRRADWLSLGRPIGPVVTVDVPLPSSRPERT